VESSWQEFRVVVQTMRWDEFEKDIKDDGREAELLAEIEQIRHLLDESKIRKDTMTDKAGLE